MTLKNYQKKRTFETTPEPSAKKVQSSSKSLVFVVQKHWASHLHYDFRLEHHGVLLSWAVPKGPSMNPSDKRLAIMVEDHPFEYRHFEGTIPKGNYGAGEVKIWDEGTYVVPDLKNRKDMEKAISEGLKKGHLEFELFGKKLKGKFALVKLQNSEKNWLLVKKKDDQAFESNVDDNEIKKKAPKTPSKAVKMPVKIKPMLATLIDKSFNHEDWIFEIKFDGYRALGYVQKNVVELRSRNDNSFNQIFPSIVNDLKKLKTEAILDGEIVVLDEKGRSNFQLMQNYQRTHQGNLVYYVFDLLYLNGKDLRDEPLLKRKSLLEDLINKANLDFVRYSEHIDAQGVDLFEKARKLELEGIIGKKKDSTYVSRRSKNWVKIKSRLRQELVIGGFTQPQGARKHFGALLLGVYENNQLKYVGHTGSGFNLKSLEEIYGQLRPLIQMKSPFTNTPKPNAKVTWVKPKLVCEVSFQEWTSDGIMRQAIFQGMRIDKDPKTVKREVQEPLKEVLDTIKDKTKESNDVKLSNPDKIYWPKPKYTKRDLFEYYREVSSYLLPYLKNRPVMIHRFPEGIDGQNFYQKDSSQLHLPDWMQTVVIPHEEKPIKYLLIQDLRSLEYVINLGTIAIHPFLAQVKALDHPDYLVIDLDPEDIDFEHVVRTANEVHKFLDSIEVDNYCKTSGGRGLHIYVPLKGKYIFEQSKHFGEIIAAIVHQKIPEITSLVRSPKKRQKKVYLDVYQNNLSQTVVAPYSARAKPFAPVSTPLEWSEVKRGLNPTDFNIKTIPKRLDKKGDLFKLVLGKGCDLKKALKRIERLFRRVECDLQTIRE